MTASPKLNAETGAVDAGARLAREPNVVGAASSMGSQGDRALGVAADMLADPSQAQSDEPAQLRPAAGSQTRTSSRPVRKVFRVPSATRALLRRVLRAVRMRRFKVAEREFRFSTSPLGRATTFAAHSCQHTCVGDASTPAAAEIAERPVVAIRAI